MNYEILTISKFDKQYKQLIKKYPSFKIELEQLGLVLSENPVLGSPLGQNCFKIRLSISSKGKGKSGGARVITNIAVRNQIVYLLSIYDKSEKENISDLELQRLLSKIPI